MPHMGTAHVLRLQQEYRDVHPVATRLAETIATELRDALHHNGISLAVPIEHRVKMWSSIEQKFMRANNDCCRIGFSGASLSELSDLVGVRVIVLFKRDIPEVRRIVEDAFTVVDEDDKTLRQTVDQFGYASVHYQVRIPKSWHSVPTFRAFQEFQAEIQIRTLAQHMWAAASHELQYKEESSVPDEMRRAIHRISSVLELVDTEFEHLLSEREEYRSRVLADGTERRLNTDVLETLLDRHLPRKNKYAYEPYSMLVWELSKLGIATDRDLEDLISRRLTGAIEEDEKIVGRRRERGEEEGNEVFFSHTGLLNMMLEAEFGMGFHGIIFDRVEAKLGADESEEAQQDASRAKK